ncbi:MAG: FtsH protease activity modulator HflK [Enterobacteriaceae bacterium]|jgi:membrane protease subunit HflK|nr:FtsH protease activity modulator HflK [Enterobacteriaceae bacterium]
MAWNQPGNNGQDRDPWGSSNNNGGNSGGGNKGGRNRGATDLDDLFRKLSEKLGGFGGKKGGNGSGQNPKFGGRLIGLAAAIVVIVWVVSGFYTIKESDLGVVTRFGKYSHTVQPGLNWKMTFVDDVIPVDVRSVRSLAASGSMLTKDENLVQAEVNIQYQVSDPVAFSFSVTNPIDSLKQATDSAVRGTIGTYPMTDALAEGRIAVRNDTQKALEQIIRPYNLGIRIVDVNYQGVRPPEAVKAAFDDVIAAREEEQKSIRNADGYANDVVPKAKGEAQRIIEDATAYKASVVLNAKGEVAGFAKILPEYKAAPEITRERLYIEMMERVLSHTRKVIANDKSNQVIMVPLEQTADKANVQSKVAHNTAVQQAINQNTSSSQTPRKESDSTDAYGSNTYGSNTYGNSSDDQRNDSVRVGRP